MRKTMIFLVLLVLVLTLGCHKKPTAASTKVELFNTAKEFFPEGRVTPPIEVFDSFGNQAGWLAFVYNETDCIGQISMVFKDVSLIGNMFSYQCSPTDVESLKQLIEEQYPGSSIGKISYVVHNSGPLWEVQLFSDGIVITDDSFSPFHYYSIDQCTSENLDICLLDIGLSTSKPEVCAEFEDKAQRNSCYALIASRGDLNNTSVCENLEGEAKEGCLKFFG